MCYIVRQYKILYNSGLAKKGDLLLHSFLFFFFFNNAILKKKSLKPPTCYTLTMLPRKQNLKNYQIAIEMYKTHTLICYEMENKLYSELYCWIKLMSKNKTVPTIYCISLKLSLFSAWPQRQSLQKFRTLGCSVYEKSYNKSFLISKQTISFLCLTTADASRSIGL